MKRSLKLMAPAILASTVCAGAWSQEADNGTDPTKLTSAAAVQIEHLDLKGGFSADTLKFIYVVPFGQKKDFNFRVQLPMVRTDVLGQSGFRLGDVSLKVNHVLTVTREYGIVVAGEAVFDTASRPEGGAGKNVLKANAVYAWFLQGGDIFAPAIVHSLSVSGDSSRAKVNGTVLDFYYVPKLADPKTFVTVDPALSFDWENDTRFASLAVTIGRAIGPAFGGNSQVFIKPTVLAGGDRPGTWGVEVGYKVIGF
jgi:hypothetical protein